MAKLCRRLKVGQMALAGEFVDCGMSDDVLPRGVERRSIGSCSAVALADDQVDMTCLSRQHIPRRRRVERTEFGVQRSAPATQDSRRSSSRRAPSCCRTRQGPRRGPRPLSAASRNRSTAPRECGQKSLPSPVAERPASDGEVKSPSQERENVFDGAYGPVHPAPFRPGSMVGTARIQGQVRLHRAMGEVDCCGPRSKEGWKAAEETEHRLERRVVARQRAPLAPRVDDIAQGVDGLTARVRLRAAAVRSPAGRHRQQGLDEANSRSVVSDGFGRRRMLFRPSVDQVEGGLDGVKLGDDVPHPLVLRIERDMRANGPGDHAADLGRQHVHPGRHVDLQLYC